MSGAIAPYIIYNLFYIVEEELLEDVNHGPAHTLTLKLLNWKYPSRTYKFFNEDSRKAYLTFMESQKTPAAEESVNEISNFLANNLSVIMSITLIIFILISTIFHFYLIKNLKDKS
jgi:hypothetical protein